MSLRCDISRCGLLCSCSGSAAIYGNKQLRHGMRLKIQLSRLPRQHLVCIELKKSCLCIGMMTQFSNTPKLKMDHMTRQSRKFPLRQHLDCENQLRIAKVMIFIITGNISK